MVMDIENLELDSISKQFEYERRCREVDGVNDIEQLKNLLKSSIKIYLKQQETFEKIIS